jgi:hypothetical protein
MIRYVKTFPPIHPGEFPTVMGYMKEPYGKKGAAGGVAVAKNGYVSIRVMRDGEMKYEEDESITSGGGTASASVYLPSRGPKFLEMIEKELSIIFGIDINGTTETRVTASTLGTKGSMLFGKASKADLWMAPIQTESVKGPEFFWRL